MKHLHLSPLAAALCVVFASSALAQPVPDAGRLLQETQPAQPAPLPQRELGLAPPAEGEVLPGGATVALTGVKIEGNTVFHEAELLALLGDVKGKTYDLAGLRELSARITRHYREAGYPFARALIPAQRFEDGVLTIRVIEGRYGRIDVQGDEAAQAFLAGLEPGAMIEGAPLERRLLLLGDQPGVKVSPILRPGQELGTGDLVVEVQRERAWRGDVGLDNHGNRYSGEIRGRANLSLDSPFTLGDRFALRAIASEEGTWQGAFDYGLPLGGSGLRANVGYSHTYYELGEDFANLDAHGTAKVASAGLSYPVLRGQQANLAIGIQYQHKNLEDRQDATATRNDKTSDVVPLTVQFDRRDSAGVTWGSLAYTVGDLELDAALEAADIASGMDSRGHFAKWNLDLARLQTTPIANFNLYGRLSAQWANKNLDSSESFLLGGPNGVRAYPVGEGNGDEGYLVQLEARYRLGSAEPYLFYDAGKVRINADNGRLAAPLADNTRSIAGSGFGIRYASGAYSLDAALAWRTHGGKPESDTRDTNPHGWVSLVWRF
ncbi:ShlB/FhaC/HecB family hemolysin secretion/activation protein [Sulfurivermis fontis]|uniref:ShlB/FhaC/HecB family hemolysin secretion/activation protein n=1 Tax=Sulfurivermis fontis TaxID=1972068 RepID=UPI0018D56445|nr:ShlB/FhaC/HecB family hemolysin secretion/activation protein [Sulfurivermis fontis]